MSDHLANEEIRYAVRWYCGATEQQINALLETPPHDRTRRDWARIAVAAFDQVGADIEKLARVL